MVVLTSFAPPTDGIKHEQPSTKLFVDSREVGIGTLFIAESNLSWRNNESGEGFSLLYPHIALHAVSRDVSRFGSECLYIMVDTCLDELMGTTNEDNEQNEDDEDNIEEPSEMTEMRFVPDDKGALDAMYHAMTFCQSQHPDPEDNLSGLSEEDDEFVDADEEGDTPLGGGDSGYVEGQVNAADHSNGFIYNDEEMEADGQFEDAEDED